MRPQFLPVLLLTFGLVAALPSAEHKQLRAGAAASNITPWLGLSINGNMHDHVVRHVHDELHARAMVLDNGEKRLAIVVVDSCMVPRQLFDDAKQQIQKSGGPPPECVLMSATHSHSCAAATGIFQSDPHLEYQQFLTHRIADAIRRAINNLAPARIGWGSAQVPEHVFNRRWRMKSGTVLRDPFGGTNDQVKMNPPVGSPDLVEPAGPTDPEVCFISLQTTNGNPIALLANYSLHYVGGVGQGVISADYFGAFAEEMTKLLRAHYHDPPFVAIMSNGTSGDINNIDFRGGQPKQPPFGQMRIVASTVAEKVGTQLQRLQYRDWIPLDTKQSQIELGVRLPSPADTAQAKQTSAKTAGPTMKTLEEIYARETVLLAEYPPRVSAILQVMRIGDLAITAIPCEVFVEIGLELKQKSPFKPTFTISLANGYNGYLPTPKHHALGGYETWRARSSYLEVDAAPKIVERLLARLAEVSTSGEKLPK